VNLAVIENKLKKPKQMKQKPWSLLFLLVCWDRQTNRHTCMPTHDTFLS